MKRRYRFLATLFLAGALISPPAIMASQDDQHKEDKTEKQNSKRVYDQEHKDYHNWDDKEDQAWRRYQSDQHKDNRDFSKANKKEQSEYWNWRHAHPDEH